MWKKWENKYKITVLLLQTPIDLLRIVEMKKVAWRSQENISDNVDAWTESQSIWEKQIKE